MTGQKTDSERTLGDVQIDDIVTIVQREMRRAAEQVREINMHQHRVLNLISRPARAPLGLTTEQLDLRKLLDWKPDAQRIRRAGKCPDCKRWRLWSYQLKMEWTLSPNHIEVGEELCGYWCGNCGWSNAGARPVWQRMKGKVTR